MWFKLISELQMQDFEAYKYRFRDVTCITGAAIGGDNGDTGFSFGY